MQTLQIEGGHRLAGELTVEGAKNAVLPILSAVLLCQTGEVRLENVPALSDVTVALSLLSSLGVSYDWQQSTLVLSAADAVYARLPEEASRQMRSSILFLGAMVARFGEAVVSFPGGCQLGARPVDLHMDGLRRLGVEIREEHGNFFAQVPEKLLGGEIILPFPSVGATENILLTAVMAEGKTRIGNPAREPEIGDLIEFLVKCGANITVGNDHIEILGGTPLHGCTHTVIPDRMEAATYLAAVAATGGELTLRGVNPIHLAGVLPVFSESGCAISTDADTIFLAAPKRLQAVHLIQTLPYPGFPTDAQAVVMAMLATARGTSVLRENIFEARFGQVGELVRMGASITTEGRMAVVRGVSRLSGTMVTCPDLRGGAALAVAGLAAEGITTLAGLEHLDRGYADFCEKLRQLGASCQRKEEHSGETKRNNRRCSA